MSQRRLPDPVIPENRDRPGATATETFADNALRVIEYAAVIIGAAMVGLSIKAALGGQWTEGIYELLLGAALVAWADR